MTKEVFELKFPFEYRGQKVERIELRRPKVRDLRSFVQRVDKDSVGAMEWTIGQLAELDEKVIGEIDIEDFAPIKNWFERFLTPMANDSAN